MGCSPRRMEYITQCIEQKTMGSTHAYIFSGIVCIPYDVPVTYIRVDVETLQDCIVQE